MSELLDQLPKREAATLRRMAEASDASPEVVAVQVLRAYLQLARDCRAALPADPLSRLAHGAQRGGL
ncbi:hypothetical protein KUV64_22105 [Mameliella alba]|uniref:hypothetical protein n=1 Tax=Mameliella alba TaxID=561184 RepID=UPI001C9810A9|nr:hypothetical protein [Mameliella alba]MBY6121832.1 hypothetical protein [Mameliella alba]